jgi:hypothetical protein
METTIHRRGVEIAAEEQSPFRSHRGLAAPDLFLDTMSKWRTWEAYPIDCMEILGNIYGNGSRHVTRREKLTETLNWESLFIPSWLSSYRSTNSLVEVNPHESTEKVKLLLNSSHLESQAVKPQRQRGDDDLE